MANKVSFIIRLKDQFSRASKAVNKNLKGINKNAKKAAISIKNKLAPAFQKLKKVATVSLLAIAALTAVAFKKIISSGADFQDSIANLSSITGASGKALAKLTDETFRLAKAAAISQIEVADAFTSIASSKSELLKDPKGLSVVTEQVLLLANAAGISVPDAVRASVGALNQFGVGADKAARFINVLAAGSKVGASLVGETADALKNVGTVAAQFNLSFEETNAIIQVLAKNEIKAADAGTALKGTLIKLEKLSGGRFAPSKIGIINSLEILGKLGLSNTQIIEEFGEESLKAILILRQNTPLIKRWTKELTGTNVAQEQADIRLATFNARMRKLGVTINESMIKTFMRLEPVLIKQTKRLTTWFDSITTEDIKLLSESLTSLLDILTLVGKALPVAVKGLKFTAETVGRAGKFFKDGEVEQASRASGFLGGPLPASASERLSTVQQPTQKARVDGEIIVSATQGTRIESTKIKTNSKGLDIGLNMTALSI